METFDKEKIEDLSLKDSVINHDDNIKESYELSPRNDAIVDPDVDVPLAVRMGRDKGRHNERRYTPFNWGNADNV